MTATREKSSFRLPPDLVRQLDGFARAKKVSRTAVVEAALASYLSPDGADRLEAAVSRRLDRVTRQVERLALHVDLSNEALSLFVRSWLSNTAPLPESAVKAAQAMGAERWERFVSTLYDRMESGVRLAQEVGLDVG
ncbi:ribbon-helix-helix protein, CopG family [Sphingomonas glacialis]|uniref:Ribbon-helix-helix protein, CopG family n=1 Tax=Sphingomonas glacialis TaxID=658225 RepID=A0A502FUC2_9SPHN|nr:ribbon-helix-helix protein, CopG family [Sphingomonas glacialis]TPG52583.1 ribbon-helix-helix protein, CopG family [Sphingomonas glacialis]